MIGQQEFKIKDSKIIRIGFCKCKDCEWQYVCPHAEVREGCKTKETIKEIVLEE